VMTRTPLASVVISISRKGVSVDVMSDRWWALLYFVTLFGAAKGRAWGDVP